MSKSKMLQRGDLFVSNSYFLNYENHFSLFNIRNNTSYYRKPYN